MSWNYYYEIVTNRIYFGKLFVCLFSSYSAPALHGAMWGPSIVVFQATFYRCMARLQSLFDQSLVMSRLPLCFSVPYSDFLAIVFVVTRRLFADEAFRSKWFLRFVMSDWPFFINSTIFDSWFTDFHQVHNLRFLIHWFSSSPRIKHSGDHFWIFSCRRKIFSFIPACVCHIGTQLWSYIFEGWLFVSHIF